MKKFMAILAVCLLAGPMATHAVPVFKTFDVVATDFSRMFGSETPSPISPLTINFSVSFDNSTDISEETTGLTINRSNLPYSAEFAYDSSTDTLALATSAIISPFGVVCENLPESFCIFIGDVSTAGPALSSVQQLTSSGGFWSANTIRYTSSSVPEPATLTLVGLGLAGFGYGRNRSKSRVIDNRSP